MLEEIRTINLHVLHILSNTQDGYTQKETDDARHIIATLRSSLSEEGQQLALWETIELNFADRAIDEGFYKLAMIAAVKAISIRELPDEEYAFGFELAKKQHMAHAQLEGLENQFFLDNQRQRGNLAFSLKQEQDIAADVRLNAEISAAHILKIQQQREAKTLAEENKATATKFAADNARTLEGFHEAAKKKESDLHGLERMLSLITSGYSVETDPSDTGFMHLYNAMVTAQKQSAKWLKEEQDQSALHLEIAQSTAANDLKKVQKELAEVSRRKEEKSATDLRDKQTIKVLCNKSLKSSLIYFSARRITAAILG